MRVFRTTYKDKDGQQRQAKKWYLEFSDHLQTRRRLPGFTDKRQTEALGRQIEKLVSGKVAGEKPDTELTRWLENIPERLRNNLVRIGLIDSQRAAAGKSLLEHIEDFRQSLLAKDNTPEYVKLLISRLKRLFYECKFTYWSELSASKVQRCLAELRESGVGISAQTSNLLPAGGAAVL